MGAPKRTSLTKKLRFEVFERDRFTCQYCGKMPPEVTLHVDHIKPIKEGGTNSIENLITSCAECNSGKGSTPLQHGLGGDSALRRMQELNEMKEIEAIFEESNKYMDEIISMVAHRISWYTEADTCKKSNCVGVYNVAREFSPEEAFEWLDIAGNNLKKTHSYSGRRFTETELIKYFYGIVKKHREATCLRPEETKEAHSAGTTSG